MSTAAEHRADDPVQALATGPGIGRLRAAARRRPRTVTALLALALVLVLAVRVLLGEYTVAVPDFFTILSGGTVDGAPAASFIVMEDKLPKALLGALSGIALGCAGAIFQLLLRNPLASPDVIGVSASASLGAIVATAFFGATGLGLAAGALVGALVASVLIFAIAAGGPGQAAGNRFVLVGIGISFLAVALTNYVFSRMSIYQAADTAVWLTGSLSQADWFRVRLLAGVLVVLLLATVLVARNLHALSVGEDLAAGVGVPVAAARWAGIVLGVLLAAFAVAMTGPISFVAFVSGPIARKLVGGPHHLTASALVGGIVVVLADFVAANCLPTGPLPVGVLTGLVGAPVLLWLVASAQKERS